MSSSPRGTHPALDAFAAVVTTNRGPTLLFIVALLATAAALIAGRGVPVDFTPQALFTTFEEQMAIDARFEDQFGSTDNVALVIVRAPDVTATRVADYVHRLGDALAERDYALRVESITRAPIPRAGAPGELIVDSPVQGDTVDDDEAAELRRALAQTTLLHGTLVSEDGDTAVVAVFLTPECEKIARLQPAIADMQQTLLDLPPPDGVSAEIGGLPNIRVYMVSRFMRDQALLVPVSMLVCMIMLFVTFRWWPAVVLPGLAVAFSGLVVVGAMAAVQEPFNIINQVVPTLIIVIGISDSIHLVSRYHEELDNAPNRLAASRNTLAAMAAACFLTSATTSIGFGSLVVSHTEILARFGVTAALAVFAAYVMTVLFLPPALTLVKAPRQVGHTGRGRIEDSVEAVFARVLRRPWTVFGLSMLGTAGMLALAAGLRVDTTLLEGFPERDPVHVQTRMIEDELNGVLPMEVSLTSATEGRFDDPEVLNAIDEVRVWLEAQDHVLGTRSYSDLLREAWAAYTGDPGKRETPFANRAQVAQLASLLEGGRPNPLEPFVSADRRHLRLNVQLRDDGSVATLALAEQLAARLGEALDGFEDLTIELSGDAYSGSLGLDSLIRDMSSSLALALVLIFGAMTLLFRSLRIGLISVLPNVIPLVGTAAYMAVRDIPLNTTTVIIFSISIGLAVDDTIHVLARFREERNAGAKMDEALLRAGRGSGRAIVVTSLMLGAGMLVMLLSSFMPVRLFGELICVTLLMCLVGDLLLLPAMLKLFARKREADLA